MRFFHLIAIEVFHWTISTLDEVQGLHIGFSSDSVRRVRSHEAHTLNNLLVFFIIILVCCFYLCSITSWKVVDVFVFHLISVYFMSKLFLCLWSLYSVHDSFAYPISVISCITNAMWRLRSKYKEFWNNSNFVPENNLDSSTKGHNFNRLGSPRGYNGI